MSEQLSVSRDATRCLPRFERGSLCAPRRRAGPCANYMAEDKSPGLDSHRQSAT